MAVTKKAFREDLLTTMQDAFFYILPFKNTIYDPFYLIYLVKITLQSDFGTHFALVFAVRTATNRPKNYNWGMQNARITLFTIILSLFGAFAFAQGDFDYVSKLNLQKEWPDEQNDEEGDGEQSDDEEEGEECSSDDEDCEQTSKKDDDDDDDDAYDHYTNENADITRASREAFSSGFALGFRLGGGVNIIRLGEEVSNWQIGYEATAGIVAQSKIGSESFFATVGLTFSYYHYRYEADLEYKETDEDNDVDWSEEDKATLDVALFEVPIVFKYLIGGGSLSFGLGGSLGLKLTGSSEFKQTIYTSNSTEVDPPHDNTLPTAGLEASGIVEIGYVVSKNFTIDLRLHQRFTNLLNMDVVAETSMLKSKLYGTHGTIGFSLFL